jgi:hypothetical protein
MTPHLERARDYEVLWAGPPLPPALVAPTFFLGGGEGTKQRMGMGGACGGGGGNPKQYEVHTNFLNNRLFLFLFD